MSAVISYVKGDATRPVGDGLKVIAHCCNDIGVWGAGFVLALSKRWKSPEANYREWYRQRMPATLPLGDVQFIGVEDDITVANIIGQRRTGFYDKVPPIRYVALEMGFRIIAQHIAIEQPGASVHMPRLGCGLAGGSWEHVAPLIEQELCARGVAVTVYDFA